MDNCREFLEIMKKYSSIFDIEDIGEKEHLKKHLEECKNCQDDWSMINYQKTLSESTKKARDTKYKRVKKIRKFYISIILSLIILYSFVFYEISALEQEKNRLDSTILSLQEKFDLIEKEKHTLQVEMDTQTILKKKKEDLEVEVSSFKAINKKLVDAQSTLEQEKKLLNSEILVLNQKIQQLEKVQVETVEGFKERLEELAKTGDSKAFPEFLKVIASSNNQELKDVALLLFGQWYDNLKINSGKFLTLEQEKKMAQEVTSGNYDAFLVGQQFSIKDVNSLTENIAMIHPNPSDLIKMKKEIHRGKKPPKGNVFPLKSHYDNLASMGDITDVQIFDKTKFGYSTKGIGPHEFEFKYKGDGTLNEAPAQFAGVMFMNLPADFGRNPAAGYDLRGFKTIKWKARSLKEPVVIEFFIGGIQFRFENEGTSKPSINYDLEYPDSMPRLSLGSYKLTKEWQEFSVSIQDQPEEHFKRILCGFGWVANWPNNDVEAEQNIDKKIIPNQEKKFEFEIQNVRYVKENK